MPALTTQATIDIAATSGAVHSKLADFHTWPFWSPWLYSEPDTHVDYRNEAGQVGHKYDWKGSKTGAGGMTLTQVRPERIDCDLQFLKPFKSSAKVWFELHEISSGRTRVTWHINSRLPFFMFFMTDAMTGMIRADYRRGLALLKDYIELGNIHSTTRLMGTVDTESVAYVGYQASTSMDTISDSMQHSFGQVTTACTAAGTPVEGSPFCFYDKVDFKRSQYSYVTALPVQEPISVDPPLISKQRPACTALMAIHTGPYRHLANAWALLMSEARHQKLKPSKQVSPFECYLNNPDNVPENDVITELYLPLRQ